MTFNEAASRLDTSIKKLFDDLIREHHVEIDNLRIELSHFHESSRRIENTRIEICHALFISDNSTWTNIRDEITKEQLIKTAVNPQSILPDPPTNLTELLNATRILNEKIKQITKILRLQLDWDVKHSGEPQLTNAYEILEDLEEDNE